MANFKIAFQKMLIHEGGYSNDPIDLGGETYKGIARNAHPNWQGDYLSIKITSLIP